MPCINILPPDLRDLIAAGEVVERPASVVKELVENSIDARSTEIIIEVLSAGKKLIRVSDNGKGMDPEDLRVCFLPHATSKISSKEDLFRITTMGFRGEALSSISAVSRMKIISSPEGSSLGLSVDVHNGKIVKEQEIAHRGTTVEVRDLFYNTPARKKFLKSDRTENHHIIETVTRVALCRPDITFKLTIDRRDVLTLPSTTELRERIAQIFGIQLIDSMLELSVAPLIAFISKEGAFRSTRSQQYIFVNNRPVRDSYLRHAVYSAYDTLLPKDKHPVFFLYLFLPPEEVDFNVHPQKTEVRFRQKNKLYNQVFHIIHRSLFDKKTDLSDPAYDKSKPPSSGYYTRNDLEVINESNHKPVVSETIPSFDLTVEGPIYLGDAFFAYSDGKGLWIVDQHAAHERIRYEKLRRPSNQSLSTFLFPKQIRLSPAAFNTLKENMSWLKKFIDIDVFGENTFVVRALPDFLNQVDLQGLLYDLAKTIQDGTGKTPIEELKDDVLKTMACHSSIRGNRRLSREELLGLLMELKEMEDPDHCPHGRPTRIKLDLKELRRLFKRQ